MDSSFNLQNDYGIMDEDEDHEFSDAESCSSFGVSTDSNASSSNLSDLTEDASSSSTSSYTPSSSLDQRVSVGPLYKMSSLMDQLPVKRSLSKYYQGKSQSYTSLSNVRSLEDLAKHEHPFRKKLKSCKSYGGGLDSHKSSKTISKKPSRLSCASLTSKKSSISFGNKPPIPTHSTSGFSNQSPLFA